MHTYTLLNKNNWPREGLAGTYRDFATPCYAVTVKLDADNLYKYAKSRGESFFLLTLYSILRAANSVPQMRQRWMDDAAVEFDTVDALTRVMGPDEVFRETLCVYAPDFISFKNGVKPVIEAAKKGQGSNVGPERRDFLCARCVPWMHFEAMSPSFQDFHQSIPALTWGKLQDGKIPIALQVSHCFVDGLHWSRFFQSIAASFANPEQLF